MFANNLPGPRKIELNVFDLVDSSIRKGPNSIVFGKFFQLEQFILFLFCIELKKYRPSELGIIIFRSKRQELRKKVMRNL